MPASDVTVSASFKAKTYTVSIFRDGSGKAEANKTVAAKNETVTLTVAPAEEYALQNLVVVGLSGTPVVVTNTTDSKKEFTMPAEDVVVVAVFTAKTDQTVYFINVAAVGNGTVCVNKAAAAEDEPVILTVAPEIGYKLNSLTVTGTKVEQTSDST